MRLLMAERPDLDVALRPVGFSTMLSSLDDGLVDAVLLHGPVATRPRRVSVTVGEVRVGVIAPRSHRIASADTVSLDTVVPFLKVSPPPGAGEEFARFWLVSDHPSAPVASDPHFAEDTATIAAVARRQGIVGLWPADVAVPEGSGSVLLRLAEERWAPLQVVYRSGLSLGPALVGAAVAAVAATGTPGVVRAVGPADRQD